MPVLHSLVVAQAYWGDHMDNDRLDWWMPVVWLAVIGLLVLGAVALIRFWSPPAVPPAPTTPVSTARTILAERYARGELTTDEFQERNAALDDAERPAP
jgi:putative membrane protein